MGERLLCKQEVVGSIPSGSTRLAVADWRLIRRIRCVVIRLGAMRCMRIVVA